MAATLAKAVAPPPPRRRPTRPSKASVERRLAGKRLRARVDRFALQREDAEHALVDAVQRLAPRRSARAPRCRARTRAGPATALWPRPRSRSRSRCSGAVYSGPVDDPQVLAAAALDAGLATSPVRRGATNVERLDDHALAARGRSAPPTMRSRPLRSLVGSVDVDGAWPRRPDVGSASRQPAGQQLHVPDVVGEGVDLAFAGEHLERRQPQVVDRLDRPAVAAGRRRRTPRPFAGAREAARSSARHRSTSGAARRGRSSAAIGAPAPAVAAAPTGGVLAAQQLLGLRRPGHELAVEARASRCRARPTGPRAVGRGADLSRSASHSSVVEERPAGARVDDPARRPSPRRSAVARPSSSRQTTTTAREPMCFSSQTTRGTPRCGSRRTPRPDAPAARALARLGRRHRRRQVDQPPRVGGEPAHHLQRGGGVLLPDRHRSRAGASR